MKPNEFSVTLTVCDALIIAHGLNDAAQGRTDIEVFSPIIEKIQAALMAAQEREDWAEIIE